MTNAIIKKILITEREMARRKSVDKHYEIINSQFKLNTVEMKILLSIIALVRKDDVDFQTYKIPIKYFDFIVENQNYSRLKGYCKNLMTKPLEINTDDGWMIFNWFSHIAYKRKDGFIEASISPRLKPYLLQMNHNFAQYDLENIMPLKSEYSIRIYEILKRYEYQYTKGKKKNIPINISLNELYETMRVPKSYMFFNEFKKKVILVSQKELAQYTDIYFDFEEEKLSRKVIGLNFKIYKNKQNEKLTEQQKHMNFVKYVRKNHVNVPLIPYKNEKYDGYIAVSEKEELYLMDKNKNSYGVEIKGDKAVLIWNNMRENQDKMLVKVDI